MTRRLFLLITAVVIAMPACDLEGLFEIFDLVDLGESNRPEERAASEAGDLFEDFVVAEQALDEALDTGEDAAFDRAAQARPTDASYRLHQSFADFVRGRSSGAGSDARRTFVEQHLHLGIEEAKKQWLAFYLGNLETFIERWGGEVVQERWDRVPLIWCSHQSMWKQDYPGDPVPPPPEGVTCSS